MLNEIVAIFNWKYVEMDFTIAVYIDLFQYRARAENKTRFSCVRSGAGRITYSRYNTHFLPVPQNIFELGAECR